MCMKLTNLHTEHKYVCPKCSINCHTEHSLNNTEIKTANTYITQLKAGTQTVDDILCQVWMVWVPNQSNCDNLWCVHQHSADPDPLPTVALKYIHSASSNIPTCSVAMLQARVLSHPKFHGVNSPDSSAGPPWCWRSEAVHQTYLVTVSLVFPAYK